VVWLRQAVLFLHLAAATFWVGEILFVALVVGPYGRSLPAGERAALLRDIGRRTLPLVWAAIGVLLATGFGNLYFLGVRPGDFLRPSFYATGFGWMLAAKLAAVVAMVGHSAAHDLVYGRRSRRLRARLAQATEAERAALEAEYARTRRAAAATGRANLVLALVVLFLAAGLGART
jgi:putative copper export protein